jgi:hypothetical protein
LPPAADIAYPCRTCARGGALKHTTFICWQSHSIPSAGKQSLLAFKLSLELFTVGSLEFVFSRFLSQLRTQRFGLLLRLQNANIVWFSEKRKGKKQSAIFKPLVPF